jgi:hypothetical protein
MTMRPAQRPPGYSRRGISLLEVLISIGILSIGLLATLSLIPAGRTYMYKAAVDDRAAALIPAAFETINTRKLLRVGALSWDPVNTTGSDPEMLATGVVIREQDGYDTTATGNGQLVDSKWTPVQSTLQQNTTDWHPQATVPTTRTISGMVDPATAPAGTPVTVHSAPVDWIPVGGATINGSGSWTASAPLPAPGAPDMQTVTSGPSVGEISSSPWWVDYTITANYTDLMGTTRSANPTPATYRQYGRRRARDVQTGTATTRYTAPAGIAPMNDNENSPSDIGMVTLDNASTTGRNVAARSVAKTITGSLWRMTVGTVQLPFTRVGTYADVDNAPITWTNSYSTADIVNNVGTFVSGSATVEDAVDWWRLPVRAGEVIVINVGTTSSLKTDVTNLYYFPVYFNSSATLLDPVPALSIAGVRYAYFIEQDGTILTRAALSDGAVNTFPTAGKPRGPERNNPQYSFTVTRLPSDRVVVVDPLAATRLDKIIYPTPSVTNAGSGNVNFLRRQRFADFFQTYAGSGRTQQRLVPRLNWAKLTTGDVDYALSVSELLFRDNDSLLLDTSGTRASADVAPAPLFDMSSANAAVRRQASGKMSWMMMLQPEDPGPAAVNWTAGKWFDVSVIVFEDRPLPAVTGGSYTGEYAQANVAGQKPLAGVWSDLDGSLTVTIPSNAADCDITDDEEARQLFRTGGWLLLAPKWILPTTNPLEDTQRYEWVKIQSARLGSINGNRTVTLLLEKEPDRQTLASSIQEALPGFNPAKLEYEVVVLAYQGVVAVVNRSVQLEN